ncbi:MAG TPA: hypothetical protein VHB02_12750 [Acidimicrobiales bacterium]|nr:hypothetical protein [Acidimicrobiales bacterium]
MVNGPAMSGAQVELALEGATARAGDGGGAERALRAVGKPSAA